MTADIHSGQAIHRMRAAAPGRILLVEDGPTDRMIARTILERAGFVVDVAEDGLEAVRAVERSPAFDLILMDLHMPVMDGYEAAARIRARKVAEGGATPILALSGRALESDADIFVSMNGRVSKPYDPSHLIDRVRALLQTKQAAEAAGDGLPVWNLRPYHDLVSRLGGDRMAGQLVRLRRKFESVTETVGRDLDDVKTLTWEAHGLVSAAGMLGFDELAAVCMRAQAATAGEPCRALAAELVAALARAIAALSDVSAS